MKAFPFRQAVGEEFIGGRGGRGAIGINSEAENRGGAEINRDSSLSYQSTVLLVIVPHP